MIHAKCGRATKAGQFHLRALTPSSDAVHALQRVHDDFSRALEEARHVAVFVSVKDVRALTGRPESTITRLCRRYGERIGARKVQGVWQLHWPTFEAFLTSGEVIQPQEVV